MVLGRKRLHHRPVVEQDATVLWAREQTCDDGDMSGPYNLPRFMRKPDPIPGRRCRAAPRGGLFGMKRRMSASTATRPKEDGARSTRRADLDGSLTVFAAVDDEPAGAFLLEDPIRPDAPRMVRALREAGVTRVVLVTGDRADIADMVGRVVGVDTVLADCDPADKLAAIERESAHGATIMVGDGVNDAPALAAAGVGVALAARGATASSEAADVVLTVDRVDALADAILIARRSKRIALQAVLIGMGLSLVAMVAAAAGFLPPAAGAVLQEVIDVLAIGIALRAVLPGAIHTDRDAPRRRRHRDPAAGRARRRAAGGRADPIGG